MRILLLSPPFVPEYMRNARCDFISLSATQWYPLLLGCCGAYLEGQNHQIKFIDAPSSGLDHQTTARLAQDFHPDLLILYTGRLSEQNDLEFGDRLVELCRCDAVIVGPYASIDPRSTLARSKTIGKLIVREFEIPAGLLASGAALSAIPNLLYKSAGRIVQNPLRENLTSAELDAIPFVSRFFKKHLDLRRYKTPSEFFPFMDLLTGRGCAWGRCTYCLWVHTYVTGPVYNCRSIPGVIEEFNAIAAEMPEVRSVMIQDDTFTEDRARDFSEAKIKSGNRLPWSCYARANMTPGTLKLMKRANCRNLHVGYESADPEVLKQIKKGVTLEQAARFTADAKKAGLRIHADFAFGFPAETPQSAQKTIDWACKLNPHTAQFQLMIPFPGTPYYDLMKQNGWLNAQGQPDMPQFSNTQIRAAAKKAYRRFYLSPRYALKCLRHPWEHFFGRLKTISRAIPAMFWKHWD